MPSSILAPNRRIPVEVLTPTSFAEYGMVIQNPHRASSSYPIPPQSTSANQGTAQRYLDIAPMTNFYHLAPSKKPAKPVISMFACSPRQTRTDKRAVIVEEPEWSTVYEEMQLLDVKMLERHPYTPQTFIPLGQSSGDTTTFYLVVVAPTLPSSRKTQNDPLLPPYPTDKPRKRRSILDVFSRARPKPFTNETTPPSKSRPASLPELPKGAGSPDLGRLRAFIVSGNQAITYVAGTWHAPMSVIGEKPIDFVVVQYMNGVGMEDTQELELRANGEGITVEVETPFESSILKAKL